MPRKEERQNHLIDKVIGSIGSKDFPIPKEKTPRGFGCQVGRNRRIGGGGFCIGRADGCKTTWSSESASVVRSGRRLYKLIDYIQYDTKDTGTSSSQGSCISHAQKLKVN